MKGFNNKKKKFSKDEIINITDEDLLGLSKKDIKDIIDRYTKIIGLNTKKINKVLFDFEVNLPSHMNNFEGNPIELFMAADEINDLKLSNFDDILKYLIDERWWDELNKKEFDKYTSQLKNQLKRKN